MRLPLVAQYYKLSFLPAFLFRPLPSFSLTFSLSSQPLSALHSSFIKASFLFRLLPLLFILTLLVLLLLSLFCNFLSFSLSLCHFLYLALLSSSSLPRCLPVSCSSLPSLVVSPYLMLLSFSYFSLFPSWHDTLLSPKETKMNRVKKTKDKQWRRKHKKEKRRKQLKSEWKIWESCRGEKETSHD